MLGWSAGEGSRWSWCVMASPPPPPTAPHFRAGERDAVNDPESTRWGRERDRHSIQRFLRPRDSKFARSGGQAGLTLRLPAEGRGSGRGRVAPAASVCSARCGVGSRRPSKYVAFYFISFCLIILIYLSVSANILNTEQNSSTGPIRPSGL